MFELGISVRLRCEDAEYLALKTHELLREIGTAELDTVYFSEVVGAVGGTSVALYLSKTNMGVLVVASACEDEGRCLLGSVKEVAKVAREVLQKVADLVEVLKVEFIVKARVTLSVPYRSVVRGLKIGGVEVSEGGSYDAGWYYVRTFKGKYIVSMKKLDVVLTVVHEKNGGLASAQVSVSRSAQGLSELPENELVDCLKAASQIIAYMTG